jgi:hypothetical protein
MRWESTDSLGGGWARVRPGLPMRENLKGGLPVPLWLSGWLGRLQETTGMQETQELLGGILLKQTLLSESHPSDSDGLHSCSAANLKARPSIDQLEQY